jgi:uncharacterized damage-inducible protein DinB
MSTDTTVSETQRIRDLFERAVGGDPWHGPSLKVLLAGISAEDAARRPIPGAHTVRELLAHASAWQDIVRRRLSGEVLPKVKAEESWPPSGMLSAAVWADEVAAFESGAQRLAEAISAFPDERLDDVVPGRDHSFYAMLHGIAEHHAYHAGQIALLRRALGIGLG